MSIPLRTPLAPLLLCAVMALSPAIAAPAAPAAPGADYAERVFAALNSYRESQGLPTLQASPALSALAAEHSLAMAGERRPSHDGFAARFDRVTGTLCVENVAMGFRQPEQVIIGWRQVPRHHQNLLEPRVRFAGIVNHGLFVTYFACDERG